MWGEKTGTQTNAERRVKLLRQVVLPPGEARSDLEIFIQVARKMGAEELFPWGSPEDVFEEWKLLSRGRPNDMTGITYERLKKATVSSGPVLLPIILAHPVCTVKAVLLRPLITLRNTRKLQRQFRQGQALDGFL